MYDGGYDHHNPFPHDGEHGRECTGYGCDCDEKNYGSRGRGSSGDSGKGIWIGFIVALIIGYGINELLGAIIMIGVIIAIALK